MQGYITHDAQGDVWQSFQDKVTDIGWLVRGCSRIFCSSRKEAQVGLLSGLESLLMHNTFTFSGGKPDRSSRHLWQSKIKRRGRELPTRPRLLSPKLLIEAVAQDYTSQTPLHVGESIMGCYQGQAQSC